MYAKIEHHRLNSLLFYFTELCKEYLKVVTSNTLMLLQIKKLKNLIY